MSIGQLFKKSKPVFMIMLVVYVLGFGAGFAAGRFKLADLNKIRASKLSELNRNLEFKVPGYGALLQKYKNWERQKLFGHLFKSRVVKSMFTIFFNNWIVGNLTMMVRAVFLAPMILYPFGRFMQGLMVAQYSVTYQTWGTLICEFGGYFLTICGMLTALFWTVLYKKFGFEARKQAFRNGLKFLGLMYLASGFFILFGSYIETMFILGMSLR
ncbi:MAG: hypothetical protein NTV82_18835 [Candidatus Aminicenantes bacterium]|nr:hypothetical protein [Candidatus Aminicenantes bacterium]